MSSYRFCRTDDVSLLVDALNHSWSPHFPGEPAVTAESFKRSIRDLQVWCSSCMVAFSGPDPIAVLIGAKRPSGTLIHKIAVHPDHCRQGHGRHLLTSLSSKLAILGPPKMFAEIPETFEPTRALFAASGYVQEAVLTDYVLGDEDEDKDARAIRTGFVIPVSVDDLVANGLLGEDYPQTCWERSVETLNARKSDIAGVAVASDERIEAYILYVKRDEDEEAEILSMRCFIDDAGARLKQLLTQLRLSGISPLMFPKATAAEMPREILEMMGFRPAGTYLLHAATPRSD